MLLLWTIYDAQQIKKTLCFLFILELSFLSWPMLLFGDGVEEICLHFWYGKFGWTIEIIDDLYRFFFNINKKDNVVLVYLNFYNFPC